MPALPFAHLNLRYNPFGELDRAERAAIAVVDVEPLADRLRTPGRAVQFLAPCGRGKTTHLLALARALPDATYVRADTDGRKTLPPTAILLLDEADVVSWWRRRRLWSGAGSLAIAVHRDLSAELRGYDVLTVEVAADFERLVRVVDTRLEAARRGPGPLPHIPEEDLARLHRRHGDDLRAIERALYARIQEDARVEV